jgi:hypothetical protein
MALMAAKNPHAQKTVCTMEVVISGGELLLPGEQEFGFFPKMSSMPNAEKPGKRPVPSLRAKRDNLAVFRSSA